MRETVVPLLVIAAVAAGAWYFREPLLKQVNTARAQVQGAFTSEPPPESSARMSEPAPRKDTIYRWVDEKGVVHYDQQPAAGSEAVVVDQSRIQSLSQYGQPQAAANGAPVVEANGDEPHKSLRAVDRFPQTQIVNP